MAVARIRLATAADAARCLAIYRPAIEESAASFETEVPTAEAVAARIESTLTTHPWVVAEGPDGRVVGYAYGATYRTRRAYQVRCPRCPLHCDSPDSTFGVLSSVPQFSQSEKSSAVL